MIFIFLFIFIIVIIYIFLINKQHFINIIKGNKINTSSDNLNFYNSKKILIGNYEDDNLKSLINGININGDLYVKDRITIGNTSLTIDDLRYIKSYPNVLDNEICLKKHGSVSCINQEHIEMLNGKRAMIINTFPEVFPFIFYKGTNYSSILFRQPFKENKNTVYKSSNETIYYKSVKILEGFKLQVYSDVNFTGDMKVIEHPGEKDITSFGESWKDGIKSYMPETNFGDNNIADRMCLSSVKFGPWQPKVLQEKITTNIFRGEPCVFTKNQEFLINKKKLYYATDDSDVSIHRHSLKEIHEDILLT